MNPEHHVWSRAQPGQAQPRSHAAARRDYRDARLPGAGENQPSGSVPSPARVIRAGALSVATQCWLGHLRITANAAQCVPAAEILGAFARHAAGDWGAMDAHDRQQNDRALITRGRLLSVHSTRAGQPFWIITDAGWEVTNVELNISVVMLSLQKCGVQPDSARFSGLRRPRTQHYWQEAMGLKSNNHMQLANGIDTAAWPHRAQRESRKKPSPSGPVAFAVETRSWLLDIPCRRAGCGRFAPECFARVAKMLSKTASWVRDFGAFRCNSTFLKTQHKDTTLLLPEDY